MTLEHVVSASVFNKDVLSVDLPMFGGSARSIGRGRLGAKLLCSTHNNALSPCDDEAAKFARAIRLQPGTGQVLTAVKGSLLERWALKTVLNCYASRWGSVTARPARSLVEIAFGRRAFSSGMGLFFSNGTVDTAQLDGPVLICTAHNLKRRPPGLLGAIFVLNHLPMILSTNSRGPAGVLEETGAQYFGFDFSKTRFLRRPAEFRYQASDASGVVATSVVSLEW